MDRNSISTRAKQFMLRTPIQNLIDRGYKFFPLTGEIWGPRGGRVDKIQFHRTSSYSSGPPRYKQVQFSDNGSKVDITAHVLIWSYYNKRWPREGYVINHIDSNRDNNIIGNLEEMTIAENARLGRRT